MLYRDPATGLIRSDSAPAQKVNLPPAQRAATATRPIPQLPVEQSRSVTAPQQAPTQSLPRRILGGIGNFGKEIVNFAARPLAAPFAGLSEDVAALARGENPWTGSRTYRPQTTALSRYAFQNTAPDSAERGYAALSRATEAATFLPELLIPGGILAKKGASLLRRGLSSAAVEAPFGAALGYLDAKRRGEDNALKQAVAGGGLAAGISIALPFAGAALRRVASPFIPSLSRSGARVAQEAAQATEGVLPKAAREAVETAAGPVLPSATSPVARTASEAVPEVLPSATAAEAPSVARSVSGGVIPEDVAMRVVAGSEDQALTSKVVNALREGSPDVFDKFGEETVMKVLKALDDQAAGLGASVERKVADNIVAKNIARRETELRAGSLTTISQKSGAAYTDAKKKIVDTASPTEDVLNRLERSEGTMILPSQDIRKQYDVVIRAPKAAQQFMLDNKLDKVITEAQKRGAYDELGEYLLAKHNEDIRIARPEVQLGRSADQDRAIIRGLESKVGDLATKVNVYAQKILDMATKEGFIGHETVAQLRKMYPNYVPINRIFSLIEDAATYDGRKRAGAGSQQTIVQSLKGSERAMQDPIKSLAEKTTDLFVQVEREKLKKQMVVAKNLTGNPFGIETLRSEQQVTERMSIWKALKESKPIKDAMERIFSSGKKEMRSLMVELRRLNVKGLKIALRKEATKAPASKISGLVDIEAFLTKKGLPKERKALESALTKMRAGASDLRAELASLNAEGYMRALAKQPVTLPPRAGVVRKIESSLGKSVNEPLLNRVIKKIEARDPKLATQLANISDAEKRLQAVKDAIRSTTKKQAEEISMVEKALSGKQLNIEDRFAEIPATLTDKETGDFIDSMIQLPDAELERVKKMIANREPKLASAMSRVEDIRNQLGMIKGMRKEAFLRGQQLADIPMPKGKVAFYTFKNGVRETHAIKQEFADFLTTATPLQLGLIEKTINVPTRILKAGATGLNIPFALFNLIKDQITGFVNSPRAWATSNPYVFLKGLFEATTHGEMYKKAVRASALDTSYSLIKSQAPFDIERIRSRANMGSFVAHIIKNPKELLSLPMEALEGFIGRGEEVRRLQEFIGTRSSLLKEGASEETATILAADAARFVTANFSRRGEWGRVLNAAFPYMGAGIQGTRSFVRAMRDNPTGTSAKLIGLVMLPFAVTTAWNLKDPARKEAYDDIPEWEKENNLIIIPPVPKKDENGRWMVYKIPLPPNVGSMVIPIRQTFEAAHGLDPARFAGLAQSLIGSTTPLNFDFSSREEMNNSLLSTFTPQIIKPSIESYANKSFFTGAPIVPEKLAGLPPEMQKRETTSNTAIAIARQLGVSPLKVEAFLKSSGGTVANQVLNALDRATVATGINPDAQIGGESITANISRRSFRAAGGEQESRMYEAAGKLKIESAGKTAALKQQASSIVDQLEKLSAREGLQLKRELLSGDMKLRKAVQNEQEERRKDLTTSDKIIKSLNISDGARAQYIKQLEAKMDPTEIKAFESDLRRKKILTADVAKQLRVKLPPR